MNLLIMGPAGSGKGTMSSTIVELYGLPHISTGDMFREAIANKTEVGLEAKAYMDQGKLVPDEVTDRIVKERLSQADCSDGYLLDGYPRNIHQAKALTAMTKELGREVDLVINLDVDYEELEKRITGRRLCKDCGEIYHVDNKPSKKEGICDVCGGKLYQRSDDTEAKLKVRHEEYLKKTEPSIEYYRNQDLVRDINGAQSPDKVMADIQKVLEAL